MRTTIDLDEDVLQAAKELASQRRTTIGKVISDLARQGLNPQNETAKTRNGVPLLASRRGAKVVTLEIVNRLRDGDVGDL